MSHAPASDSAPASGPGGRGPGPRRAAESTGGPSAQDRAFIALLGAYRSHGGLSRLCGPAPGARVRTEGWTVDVEARLVTGALFGFHWHDDFWIPLFQFDGPGPTLARGPQRVAAELGRGFDGWALASWFVQPNAWLADNTPIAWLPSRLPDVLAAARADRWVGKG